MTKSIDDYSAQILQYHVELQRLPPQHPDFEKTEDQLSRQLTAWVKKLNITVQIANNETTPWLETEIGYTCIPMSLKKDSQMRQTGDYVAYLDDYDSFCGLCVERKTLEDLHGTLMNKDRRGRLYREIARYEGDHRFNRFMLIAECSYEDFLQFVPEIFVFTMNSAPNTLIKNIIQYLKRFYKIKVLPQHITLKNDGGLIYIRTDDNQIDIVEMEDGAQVFINGVLRETLVPKRSEYGKMQYFIRRGATEASKIETMNSLENRIQVSFVGSRARAVEKYGGLVRQWCRLNYKEVLNIES